MPKPSPRNSFLYIQLVFGVLLILVFCIRFFGYDQKVLPVYYPVPDFRLTDSNGKAVSKKDLEGKVWIADFIFTRCAGQCPMMTSKMSAFSKEMKDVFFVSFSVDPSFDTPEVLSAYADGYGADRRTWKFLTGRMEQINFIAQSLKLSRIDEPTMHSARFILIDKKGQVRGYYDSGDSQSIYQLKKDVDFLKKK